MKEKDYSGIFGKSIGILGISLVFFFLINIVIQIILFLPQVIDEADFITQVIYVGVYSISLLASLLIWRKQFSVEDVLGVSTLSTLIVLMINTIIFLVFDDFEIIKLIIHAIVTFGIVYTFLKIVTKNSDVSKRIIRYLTVFVIGIYPISFFFFIYFSILHDMIKN